MITIERTGNTYSTASSEFKVTYPDGTSENLWSPVWHNMTDEEEETEALNQAKIRWEGRKDNVGNN